MDPSEYRQLSEKANALSGTPALEGDLCLSMTYTCSLLAGERVGREAEVRDHGLRLADEDLAMHPVVPDVQVALSPAHGREPRREGRLRLLQRRAGLGHMVESR
jgi:hypothetical protein